MLENTRNKQGDNNIVSFIPNGDYYFQKALHELDREQIDKAYKYIKRAAELSPDDAQILMQYGILQMDSGKFEHAYELIHTAYSLEPSNPDIIFMLAEISGYIGFLHDAKKYALEYLNLEPNGIYRLEAEDILQFAEEEQDLIVEIEDDEKGKIIALDKSQRLMEERQFEQAVAVLEEAIEQYPTEWSAYNNLALAYFYLGDNEQASALLNHVMRETNGTNIHALCNLAVIAYSKMESEELEKYIEVLTKIQPYNMENRHKLGATLALIGENETAFKWLYSLYKKGYTGDSGFYYWLANSAYFTNREELAQAMWKRLLELDPSKEGLEPWQKYNNNAPSYSPAKDLDYIVNSLNSSSLKERMTALFILSVSPYKQEVIAHPMWLNVDSFQQVEKLALAYILGHPLNVKNEIEKLVFVAMQAAMLVVEKSDSLNLMTKGILDQLFTAFSSSIEMEKKFINAKGLAAASEYIFMDMYGNEVTKKSLAEKYDVSVSTITKYFQLSLEVLPFLAEIYSDETP